MKSLPQRKDNRLKNYDYSQTGYYFVTICVKNKRGILSSVNVGKHNVLPKLSKIGEITDKAIRNISIIYKTAEVDKYVIMPNHVHLIIAIKSCAGSTLCPPTISQIIKQCKEHVTKQIGESIWQSSFHDHIIRNEQDHQKHWQYINENPARWTEDEFYII